MRVILYQLILAPKRSSLDLADPRAHTRNGQAAISKQEANVSVES